MDINLTVSSSLKKLMAEKCFTVSELALQSDIPRTTLNLILLDSTKNPRIDTVVKLARFFGVSVDFFLGLEKPSPKEHKIVKQLTKTDKGLIPIIPLAKIKFWHQNPMSINTQDVQMAAISTKLKEKSFATRIDNEGRSIFPKDSIVIVEPQDEYAADDYVVISIRNSKATIRKVIEESGMLYFSPFYHGIAAESFNEANVIYGKIIENRVNI